MEIELKNNGQSFYEMFKMMRPDSELPVAECVHKDASFNVIGPNGEKLYVVGFNLNEFEAPGEEPRIERSEAIVIKPTILISAENEKAEMMRIYNIRFEDGKYIMPQMSLNRFNIIHETKCRTAASVVKAITKKVHDEYVKNMFREYGVKFDEKGRAVMSKEAIQEFNIQHNMHLETPRMIVTLIQKGFVVPHAEKTEVNKIWPVCKICVSKKRENITETEDDGHKYKRFGETYKEDTKYNFAAERKFIGNSDKLDYEITTTKKVNGRFSAKKTIYTEYGGVKEIIEYTVYNKYRKMKMKHTYYRGNLKAFREGVIIPKEITKVSTREYDRGVLVAGQTLEYDKFNRLIKEKTMKLNSDMFVETTETHYNIGRIADTTVSKPTKADPFNYLHEEFDIKGRLVLRKETDVDGRVHRTYIRYAITKAFDAWDKSGFMTSGAPIRIFDIDKGVFYDWVNMIKDSDTQDVTLKLSSL